MAALGLGVDVRNLGNASPKVITKVVLSLIVLGRVSLIAIWISGASIHLNRPPEQVRGSRSYRDLLITKAPGTTRISRNARLPGPSFPAVALRRSAGSVPYQNGRAS